MTRAQRRIHRRTWLALAVVLPALLVLAALLRAQHARVLAVHTPSRGAP